MAGRNNRSKCLVGMLLALGIMSGWLTLEAQEIQTPGPESSAVGPREGIKVHGHWTIEVRNPDNTLATHREFENSLQPLIGSQALVGLLSRTSSAGLWGIFIDNGGVGTGPCPTTAGQCIIGEANSTLPASATFFKTLTVITATAGTQLVLSGTATPSQNGSIAFVGTFNDLCPSSVLPASCNEGTPGVTPLGFTATSISPLSIVSGQIIQVTVTISFS